MNWIFRFKTPIPWFFRQICRFLFAILSISFWFFRKKFGFNRWIFAGLFRVGFCCPGGCFCSRKWIFHPVWSGLLRFSAISKDQFGRKFGYPSSYWNVGSNFRWFLSRFREFFPRIGFSLIRFIDLNLEFLANIGFFHFRFTAENFEILGYFLIIQPVISEFFQIDHFVRFDWKIGRVFQLVRKWFFLYQQLYRWPHLL